MADGTITIATELVTDKFDKQINELEKKMQKEERKKIQKEIEIQGLQKDINAYDEAQKKAEEYTKILQKLEEQKNKIMQGNYTFVLPQGTVEFSNEYKDVQREIEKINSDLLTQNEIINAQNGSINKNRAKLEVLKGIHQDITSNITDYKSKIESIELEKQNAQIQKFKNNFNQVGNSIENSIKKVGRLVLGIFGIRTALSALRRASSDLAGYDEQYATNLEYIRFVLTQAIAPVLRGIVSMAMKLLQLINMIVNALFGVNLFSKGSAESFNKMKKGASGVSKAVKEIKKDITGWDEVTKLSDQSDSGTSVGAGGVGMPSMDLSSLQGKTPEWIKWLADNKDLVLAILTEIASGLLAIKLGLSGIKALGIMIFVTSIIKLIQDLKKYLKDPSWENFGKIIQDIGIAIAGLALIFGNVPLAVAGAITVIVGLLIQNWNKIKKGFDKVIEIINGGIEGIQKWFVENIDEIWDKTGWLGVGIVGIVVGLVSSIMGIISGLIETIKQLLNGLFTGIKNIFDGILQIFRDNFKQGIITVMKGIGNIIIGVINTVTSAINAILYPIRALIVEGGRLAGKNLTMDIVKIPQIPLLKVGGIVNMPNKGTLVGSAIAGESGAERSITFDRYTGYGNIRKRNWKMDNN